MYEWWLHLKKSARTAQFPVAWKGHQLTSQRYWFLICSCELWVQLVPDNKETPWERKLSSRALEQWKASNWADVCWVSSVCFCRVCRPVLPVPSSWTVSDMAGTGPRGKHRKALKGRGRLRFWPAAFVHVESSVYLWKTGCRASTANFEHLLCAKSCAVCWEHKTLICGPWPPGDQKQ